MEGMFVASRKCTGDHEDLAHLDNEAMQLLAVSIARQLGKSERYLMRLGCAPHVSCAQPPVDRLGACVFGYPVAWAASEDDMELLNHSYVNFAEHVGWCGAHERLQHAKAKLQAHFSPAKCETGRVKRPNRSEQHVGLVATS